MRILVTAGPTREYLDPIRFLSNASTGRMGFAVAEAALAAGHQVVLVAGPVSLEPPRGAVYISVTSAQDMYEAALSSWYDCDGAVAAAAVADFRPTRTAPRKIKKADLSLHIELAPNPDILQAMGDDKGDRWLCGFALETEDLLTRARAKLEAKHLDLIVANEAKVIGQPVSRIAVLDRTGQVLLESRGPKPELARQLVALLDQRFGTAG